MDSARTAIFLGAGASCSEGAPNQAQLIEAFFRESFENYYQIAEGRASLTEIRVLKNRLVRFFDLFFGFNPETGQESVAFPTFEEALGVLDLALSRDDGFRGIDGNMRPEQLGITVRNLRRDFVSLIALILDRTLENTKGSHTTLIGNLKRHRLLNECAFVSFNYDILIDNALAQQHDNGHDFINYGIEFANPSARVAPAHGHACVPLLKLHGSLNWLYCSTCHSVTLTEFRKGVCDLIVDPHRCRCGVCNSLSVPIIVPPTYFKAFSNLFLQTVWHRAEKVLSGCRTWVFCGYSFPDADMHVKYLLKRVQVNSPGPRQVVVVNWFPQKDGRQEAEEKQRFDRFLGNNVRLKYERVSFEQFAKSPERFLAANGDSSGF